MVAKSIFPGTGPVRSVVGVAGDPEASVMTEAGIGAVMPWADRLWFLNYPDTANQGSGLGLWSMGADLRPRLEAETNQCDTARLIHNGRLYIGRHVVAKDGTVTPITGWAGGARVTAYAYLAGSAFLWAFTMEGSVYRIDTGTNVATVVNTTIAGSANLNISGLVHGKAAWGHPSGRYIFVALNGNEGNGRLAVYDTTFGGSNGAWTNLDAGNNSWIEVAGAYEWNKHFFATGHDHKSGLLWVFDGTGYSATPRKFRLPLGSEQMLATYQQEWQRIRQVETERFMMDLHGTFYELSPLLSAGDVFATGYPRIHPIARHMRTTPDFVYWNGYLVLAGNQNTPQASNKFPNAGQPNSGLLLTTSDDLWSWGKPSGTGYWYSHQNVASGADSDPMLIKGYEQKEVHLVNGTGSDVAIDVRVHMAESQTIYTYVSLTVPANGHAAAVLPGGDWVSVKPQATVSDLTAWVVCS